MIKTDKYGIYHATNEGYCSWYEFTCEIFKQAGINTGYSYKNRGLSHKSETPEEFKTE